MTTHPDLHSPDLDGRATEASDTPYPTPGPWAFANPTRVVFGIDSLARLPELVRGRSTVIVTFPEARSIGLTERLIALLGETLLEIITDTQTNPDVAELARLHDDFHARHATCALLVAIGGGSVIDTAKALAVTAPRAPDSNAPGPFAHLAKHLATGTVFAPARAIPLIAVPTTAGTGSEVTGWATVWDRQAGRKYSLSLAETWPEAALIDPTLALTLPAGPTLSSGLDALSHALESIWNTNHNPVSDALAVSAARQVMAVLPHLMKDTTNLSLRAKMSQAAVMAGLAFSNTKTALAHSISYPMTLEHGLPHGLACSFSLPLVLELAIGASPSRDRVLEIIFGAPLASAPERLRAFIEGLGLSTRFGDHGVGPEAERRMIADALQGVRGLNFLGRRNP
jgi:hypothetical protein